MTEKAVLEGIEDEIGRRARLLEAAEDRGLECEDGEERIGALAKLWDMFKGPEIGKPPMKIWRHDEDNEK